ncbi:MAG TPA: hypothetical protein ENJ95_07590 [Bacteroidetes bacterium]|nr:hypothetical protein [Bacteroidota bacterium]
MPIEAFMPCLGEVDACVTSGEKNVPEGCCPGSGKDSAKILSPGADWVAEYDIKYQGTLFALIDGSESWNIELWLENVGGTPDTNVQKADTIAHVQSSVATAINGTITVPYASLTAGAIYKQVFKVELKVGKQLIVCGFSEGDIFHVSEG